MCNSYIDFPLAVERVERECVLQWGRERDRALSSVAVFLEGRTLAPLDGLTAKLRLKSMDWQQGALWDAPQWAELRAKRADTVKN